MIFSSFVNIILHNLTVNSLTIYVDFFYILLVKENEVKYEQ